MGKTPTTAAAASPAGSACDLLSVAWYAHADRLLDNEARAWMRTLPRRIDLVAGSRRLAVIHGSPTSINQFVFASAPDAAFRELIERSGCDGVIGGHCGIPFTRCVDGRLWHNPGAIGVPANDGTPRVWFSILRPKGDGIELTHHPLQYDHQAAAAAMRQAGLPAGYADAMQTGLWPSTDVLPPAERAPSRHPSGVRRCGMAGRGGCFGSHVNQRSDWTGRIIRLPVIGSLLLPPVLPVAARIATHHVMRRP